MKRTPRVRICIHCRQPENDCTPECIAEGDELERKTREAQNKPKPTSLPVYEGLDIYLTRRYGVGGPLSHFSAGLGGFYDGQEL